MLDPSPFSLGGNPALRSAAVLAALAAPLAAAARFEPGAPFDAAPFGREVRDEAGRWIEIRWAEPRKILEVAAEFDPPAAPAEDIEVQYWRSKWDGRADRVLSEADPGAAGWAAADDWTNGSWLEAAAAKRVEGNATVFRFEPAGRREFPGLDGPGAQYRRTLKVRVLAPRPSGLPARLRALTASTLRSASVRIEFAEPGEPRALAPAAGEGGGLSERLGPAERGRIEVENGAVLSLRAVEGSGAALGEGGSWTLAGLSGAIEAEILRAVDPVDPRCDRAIVTVRSDRRPFSFALDEVARGERILVDDLGAFVARGDDPISIGEFRRLRTELGPSTVYRRIFDEPEQTLERAWRDMPLKRPLYFVHGLPGNRNAMRQDPNGSIAVTARRHWFERPRSPKDSERKLWGGEELAVDFGFPREELRGGRELAEGYLPLLRTWWQDGPVHYEFETILDALDGDLSEIEGDDPTLLLAKIRATNVSETSAARAALRFRTDAGGPEDLAVEGLLALAPFRGERRVRFVVGLGGRGALAKDGRACRWEIDLRPGEGHTVWIAIPSVTIASPEEIEAVRRRSFERDSARVLAYWRELTARGAEIATGEPWLDGFYRAHLRHLLVNCVREPGSDRLHAHVGTFAYGVFPDESAMMVSDLDRRGCHREAERCLESFLAYQGTASLPGNFSSRDGLFYGSGGHEMGGYPKSHGWVLWCLAEHWRLTRDRAWMARAAPRIVRGCDWVVRERKRTMELGPRGERPLEYGFLPAGSLEDVTDYWYWVVTNACTVWGFESAASALEDYGHEEAPRLIAEARAYREDFLRGVTESRIRAPVVRLRDGTYVPKFPSRLYERGRAQGWLRETLEGSIHLLITGMLDPEGPEARWILSDYEDNLYISDAYGYAIPAFERFWFSRGGFSMQANLLGGPLPYLYRDEVKHFLRAYLNAFASAFYPEVRMLNEHSLPELGYPAGDHFKSSDEAQSTAWLRLMFVRERKDCLYLAQAIPRAWLGDGRAVSIGRAATHFGTVSFRISSHAAAGWMEAALDPPARNPPARIFLRFRHPDAKPIRSAEVDGAPVEFDAARDWVVLPGGLGRRARVVVRY